MDLYYEATSAIPIRLSNKNIKSFAPIESTVSTNKTINDYYTKTNFNELTESEVGNNEIITFPNVKTSVRDIVGLSSNHNDKIYHAVDVTQKDLTTFMEQMTTQQLQSVMEFFDTMPKLRHTINVTNPNTKKKGEVVVEGLQNFLG